MLRVIAVGDEVVAGIEDTDDTEVVAARSQAEVAAAPVALYPVQLGDQLTQRSGHRFTGEAVIPFEGDDVNEGHRVLLPHRGSAERIVGDLDLACCGRGPQLVEIVECLLGVGV